MSLKHVSLLTVSCRCQSGRINMATKMARVMRKVKGRYEVVKSKDTGKANTKNTQVRKTRGKAESAGLSKKASETSNSESEPEESGGVRIGHPSDNSTPLKSPGKKNVKSKSPMLPKNGTEKGNNNVTPKRTPARKQLMPSDTENSPWKGPTWSAENEELLVQLWEEEEHLYNLRHEDYRDPRKKLISLQRIAAALNMNGKHGDTSLCLRYHFK